MAWKTESLQSELQEASQLNLCWKKVDRGLDPIKLDWNLSGVASDQEGGRDIYRYQRFFWV